MLDYLIIGEKSSQDFGASVSKRTISQPSKKTIRETVPFSNVTYDFSKINGELYWEDRKLNYEFEMIADTPRELEQMKAAFSDWVMNVFEADISDPHIPDYHFRGTFESVSFADDEEMDKTTAAVAFVAYPYKIANKPTEYACTLAAKGEEETITIQNNSSHRLAPEIYISGGSATLTFDGATYSFSPGVYNYEKIKIPVGVSAVTVRNAGDTECTVQISFFEEVF